MLPKADPKKKQIDKLDFIKMENSGLQKAPLRNKKTSQTQGGNVYMHVKGLVFRIHKDVFQLHKTNNAIL